MIVNRTNLDNLFIGYKALFQAGIDAAASQYKALSMIVPSTTREETYGWLGAFPRIREWIGPRVINSLSVSAYTILNLKFEETIAVDRVSIEDDRVGVFAPMFQQIGRQTELFPDELVFGLLRDGFTTPCYDGQNFFDTDHPVGANGLTDVVSVSNMQAGGGPAWFLLDAGQAIKPLIYQERIAFKLTKLDKDEDDEVFFNDEYTYGVRGRCNAGYGLWQLAFASKADLDTANYEAARVAMQELKSDNGRPLAIKPTHLVVPPALEGAGRRLLKALNPDGGTNEWADSTKLVVSPWLL